MLRKLFPNILFDAKPEDGGSSSPDTSTGALGQDSSPKPDAKGDKAEPTMADVIAEQLAKSGSKPEGETTEDGDTSTSENDDDADESKSRSENEPDKKEEQKKEGEEKVEGEEKKETDEEKEKVEGEDKGEEGDDKSKVTELKLGEPVPYTRFSEIVKERDTFKTQIEQAKPMVDNYRQLADYCARFNITTEQFNKVMNVQALLNTDPESALKELLPIVDSLKGFTGDKLPEDLQKEVDAGDLPLARAKEISQLRARTQFGDGKLKHEKQTLEQQRQSFMQKQLADGASQWESSKRKTDPDYKPKAKDSDADGKWEMVKDKFLAMLNETNEQGELRNPVQNPSQMVALMEKAYLGVGNTLKRFNLKPATRKTIPSNGSSNTSGRSNKSIEDANSLQEAVAIGLRNNGHKL